MAATIRIKRSAVGGNPATLAAGELAYSSLADNGSNGGDRLYIGTGTETNGNAANHEVIGGKYFTAIIDSATNANTASTLVKRDGSGNFSAGTITATLSGNASTASTWQTARTITLGGDLTGNVSINGSQDVTLTATIAANSVALGTDTTGNYVASITNGSYLTGGDGGGEGSTLTLAVDATSTNTASKVVARDSSGNFAAGTITANLTGNASTATTLQTARTISITGDLSYTSGGFDGSGNVTGTGTLATILDNTTNKVPGTYGSSAAVPVITVDAKGRITAITTAATSSALTIAGGTGTDTVTVGTDTLTFAGGTGVTTTVTNNQVSFAIGQAVGTTSNVTFNDLTVSGNLTVSGTTTTINTTTLDVADLNITVAKNAANAAAANGAGLTVAGPTTPATLTYTSADDRWNFNKNLNVNTVYGALSGNASTATALQTGRTISLTGDVTYTSGSFDGSGNVTGTATLATVNSNVGSYGTSTSVPAITVNAKGLVTAVTTNAIPTATTSVLGLASFNSSEFTVTAGAVSISAVDGGTY